jgi:glutamyl/glutaminyl-tRNA synthetase
MHLEHARRLLESGRAYECYMSTEELDARRREAEAAKRPFRYEGWHRELSEAEKAAYRAEGRKPVLRLRVDAPAEGFVVKRPDQGGDAISRRSRSTISLLCGRTGRRRFTWRTWWTTRRCGSRT